LPQKIWKIADFDKEEAARMAGELNIDAFTVLLLMTRGYRTEDEINGFLFDDGSFSDPFLLKDMNKAVERIRKAVDENEKITIYGDYDADGITSTALLYLYLESLGADVAYYIPSRFEDGYGMHTNPIDKICADSTKLIITVDNGITAVKEADYIKKLGMELIITDHHTTGDTLPYACAIVDPKRPGAESGFRDYAGVGVVFKLISALEDGGCEEILENYADLIALGTVADIVPLTGENRTLAKRGLELINSGSRPGIEALKETAGQAGKLINSTDIAFFLAPRINAAGRMGSAYDALELLLTDDFDIARGLAEKIETANNERHKAEDVIYGEINEYLHKNPDILCDKILVLSGKDWHHGVLGIAAAKQAEKYVRPCLIISKDGDGNSRGSARSIDGFSIYEALKSAAHLLTRFGGHSQAAGFSLDEENIEKLRGILTDYADSAQPFYPELTLDCKVNPKNVSPALIDGFLELEPFGQGNPAPLFGIYNVVIRKIQPAGNGKHIRMALEKDKAVIYAFKFRTEEPYFPYFPGDAVDIAVRLEKNEYNGETGVNIHIKDIRPAGLDSPVFAESLALFEKAAGGSPLTDGEILKIRPDKPLITEIYKFLKKKGGKQYDAEHFLRPLAINERDACKIKTSLLALVQLGLATVNENGVYAITENPGKTSLSNAPVLQMLDFTE